MAEKLILPSSFQGLPVVTAARMQELDRKAAALGVSTETLMENAGRGVAEEVLEFARRALGLPPSGLRVVVCCGRGNNGGDGLVAARHLKAQGAEPSVFLVAAKEDRVYAPEVAANLERAKSGGVPVETVSKEDEECGTLVEALKLAQVAVDALLGTGSSGRPQGVIRKMIQAMMKSKVPLVAVDLPSGLHPDTGYHSGVYVEAKLTLTLGLAKRGLLATHAQRYVGELKVLDIGFPKELYS